jgi:hypothetical protein
MNTRYFLAELDYAFKQLGFGATCHALRVSADELNFAEYGEVRFAGDTLELLDGSGQNTPKPDSLVLRCAEVTCCIWWTWRRREDGTFDYADMAKRAMEWFMAQKETQNG